MSGIVFTDDAARHYFQAIKEAAPDIPLWTLEDAEAVHADVAISWAPPAGAYRRLPKLRLIHSIGAGVNQIIAEPSGGHVPLCRVVDPEQASIMARYVLWGVLNFHRDFDRFRRAQQHKRWDPFGQRPASEFVVGVMGMGVMGRTVAASIARLGFDVRGWSRGGCQVEGVQSFNEHRLDAFLDGLDIVICLLPLTPATHGILSEKLFAKLNRGAHVIHVGRGEHLVSADLRTALDAHRLGGALIDVFPDEPLPAEDPLWTHGKVLITPHVAAISSRRTVADQIVANVRSLHGGIALSNQVQRERGY